MKNPKISMLLCFGIVGILNVSTSLALPPQPIIEEVVQEASQVIEEAVDQTIQIYDSIPPSQLQEHLQTLLEKPLKEVTDRLPPGWKLSAQMFQSAIKLIPADQLHAWINSWLSQVKDSVRRMDSDKWVSGLGGITTLAILYVGAKTLHTEYQTDGWNGYYLSNSKVTAPLILMCSVMTLAPTKIFSSDSELKQWSQAVGVSATIAFLLVGTAEAISCARTWSGI